MDRREFVYGLGAAAASFQPSAFSFEPLDAKARIPRIGVQLYTVRDLMRTDFEGTLARVAAIGFKEVEFAGYFTRTPGQVRDVPYAGAGAGRPAPESPGGARHAHRHRAAGR